MKKIKIEETLNNAVNAFFETDADKNVEALAFADGATILQIKEQTTFTEKVGFWMNLARQAFLFLPGAFLLYFATLSTVFFFSEAGLNFTILFWLFSGGFLCSVGLGSLKNRKNLLISFSIVAFSAVAAILFSSFPSHIQPKLYFEYSIYLFPAALVFSRLLKHWIDDK